MYRWIWRQLPTTRLLRYTVLTALVLATVAALMICVFPFVDAHLPTSQVTVGR